MVGDNLETDILFGKNSGVSTMLVMTGELWLVQLGHHASCSNSRGNPTGVTSEAVLEASTTRPDYIIASLGDLSVLAEKASQ
jgi:4-nitrophenyl phosphatase